MVGTNLKAETMKLMDTRTAIETEMDAIIHRLTQPGGPGLSGNLLDSEGFPRADVDISAVRADRNGLAALRNDYKDITEKINQNIEVLHSAKLTSAKEPGFSVDATSSASFGSSVAASTTSTIDLDIAFARPFAVVDEITEGSPAAEDGLQLGDQVVKFGSVESGENLLQKLAAEVQSSQGCAVSMIVMRHGASMNLAVTPRAWEGHGLLGCHFRLL